jgi:hypothetical protein
MPGPQELPSREEYDAKWSRYPESPGPVDWRAPHHGEPDVTFEALCTLAEEWHLRGFLSIRRQGLPQGPEGEEWRLWDQLTVGVDAISPPVVTAYVSSGRAGLHSAAARAVEKLEAAAE